VPGAESPPAPLSIGSAQANGLTAGSWCPYGGPTEPGDQRPDDALSLCFDSDSLTEPLAILGFPRVRLRLSADRPRAVLAVRLCDVAPTGESLLVTRGVLNLTHRHGHDRADQLVPGEPFDVALTLDCAGHRFAAGHRIRVSVSPTYWPWVWPAPEPVTLSVTAAASTLELPVVAGRDAAELPAPELPPPEVTARLEVTWITQSPFRQSIVHDLSAGSIELRSQPDFLAGRRRLVDLGLEAEDWGENVYRIEEGRPLSAEVMCRRRAGLGRDGWETRIEADARMRATATEYLVDTELRAFAGGQLIVTRRFATRVERRD
jgi:hypothetical protein